MSGKLKTKGNMMLATKLDGVLKVIDHRSFDAVELTCPSLQAAKAKAKL